MRTLGTPKLLRFGTFEADLRTGELRKSGRKISLQEQPFKVLATLLERPGEMLSRDEIREKIWSAGTFVDFDTALNKAIAKIREVLGDSAESPIFIETLPRRGYRFIAPVEVVSKDPDVTLPSEPSETATVEEEAPRATPVRSESSDVRKTNMPAPGYQRLWAGVAAVLVLGGAAGWIWWAGTHRIHKFDAIAVLPLENLANAPDQDYFADGITDELITELAKIGSLRVISRTSIMRYRHSGRPLPEIGRELGVQAIVEGTVLRAGDRIRITAQLIDASTDHHLWAQSYEQNLGDILALQARVAQDIATHVNAKLSGEQNRLAHPPVRPEAYDCYLKGLFFWNKRSENDARQAIQYFQQALQIQPDYADAYAGIAESYVVLGWDSGVVPPQQVFSKAKAAALKALQLDSSSSPAHLALMWVELFYEWNWSEAEKEVKEAIRLSPNSVTAHHHYSRLLAFTGRFDEAMGESRRSVQLDPLDPIAGGSVAWNSYLARRYDEAIRQSRQMIEMFPSMPGFYEILGISCEARGRFSDSIEAFKQALARGASASGMADLAHAYASAGDRSAALRMLQELTALSRQQYVTPYYFALIYAGLHDNDRALEWLERAYEEHSPHLVFLLTEPKFDPLRSDRRFSQLLARVGFPASVKAFSTRPNSL